MTEVEYRVRPVDRFVVTRWYQATGSGGVETLGEYANYEIAHAVAYALCKTEHEKLGYPLDDPRIQYPKHKDEETLEQALADIQPMFDRMDLNEPMLAVEKQ